MADEILDPQRTAVVFFDTLKVYAYERDLKTVAPAARAQVDALVALMQIARARAIPIFYARADHRPDGKDAASAITDLDLGRAGLPPSPTDPFARRVWGTPAADVIDEIAPQPGDYQIPKHRWNMFFQTELELSLRARGIDTIVLAGGSTEVGIASSTYAARDLDFNVILVRDALRSGRGPWVSDFFVNEIAPGIARVRSLAQVAALLGVTVPRGAPTPPAAPSSPPAPPPPIPAEGDPALQPGRTALLLFDLLKGGHYDPATRTLRPDAQPHVFAAQRMLAAARQYGATIVYTQPIHRPDGADWCSALTDRVARPNVERFGRLRINPGSTADTYETEVVDELAPAAGDVRIRKHRYSAFHGTPLELTLRRMGVENVLLAGVATNAGVASTAYAARDHDFSLVILRDACRASSPAISRYCMDHLFPRLGRVRTVDEASALLAKHT